MSYYYDIILFSHNFLCVSPSLREVSLSDCRNVTDLGMRELAKLGENLRYLSVAKCEKVSHRNRDFCYFLVMCTEVINYAAVLFFSCFENLTIVEAKLP